MSATPQLQLQNEVLRLRTLIQDGEVTEEEGRAGAYATADQLGIRADERWHIVESGLKGIAVIPERPAGLPRAPMNGGSKYGPSDGRQLVCRVASEIEPRDVDFIWNGRLARGKHTCIGGDPGTAKSQIVYSIVAAITTGGPWPCGEGLAPLGNVIILSAEDDPDDTIVPRLLAAGADLTRVHIVSAVSSQDGKGVKTFNLQADLDLLQQKIDEVGEVALVSMDPVSSYLGGKTDSHKNAEVRGVLEPISEMAARTRVAILSVTHFSKDGAGSSKKALHRFIGSIAFVGAPRAAFAVIADSDNEGRMLFLHAKNNMAAPAPGLAYRVVQRMVGDLTRAVPYVEWEADHVKMTANEAMAAEVEGGEKRSALAEAMEFLREKLAAGPVPARTVEDDAEALCISIRTLKRARQRLGVHAEKAGMDGGWIWSLSPEGGQKTPKGAK